MTHRPPPHAAVNRRLPAVRCAYGLLLVTAPGPLIRLGQGREADPRARRVARVLGARHILQTALATKAPGRATLTVGVAVDLARGASMLAVAVADHKRRRVGLLDAAAAASFATAGLLAARNIATAGRRRR